MHETWQVDIKKKKKAVKNVEFTALYNVSATNHSGSVILSTP